MNNNSKGREGGWGTFEFALEDSEPIYVVWVVQPEVHLNERLASLEAKHVPRLGLGEQLGDGTLGELQDRLTKQLLAQVVELQQLLHLGCNEGGVQFLGHGGHLE